MYIVRFIIILLYGISVNCYAAGTLEEFANLQKASLLLLDENREVVYSRNSDQLQIPASTVKLLTALMAIDLWGRDHHFFTELYRDKQNNLVIKGLGDPFLVSEEIDLMVNGLVDLGINQFSSILIDANYFQENLFISGQGISNNPYDAAVSPLAANFNTVEIHIDEHGVITGEPQTPITPLALLLAKDLSVGKHRVNLGKAKYSGMYFVELLTAKLQMKNIMVNNDSVLLSDSRDLELLYTHHNSKPLGEVISAMLEYSNNFIANQLYLMMGAEKFGAPASLEKSQRFAREYIEQHFSWRDYSLSDGAGLSRENRLSARQLIEVLHKFAPYRELMPRQNDQIFAKSGTLRGVSSYAGYLQGRQQMYVFSVLINQPVRYRFREQLAVELLEFFD